MFWTRLSELAKSRHKTVCKVCSEMGITSGIASYWKKGALPNAAKLMEIADYFGCTIDYLLGREDKLNDEFADIGYKKIIDNLRKLPVCQQYKAIADILDLLEKNYS